MSKPKLEVVPGEDAQTEDVGKAEVTIFNIDSGESNVSPVDSDKKIFGKHASQILPPPLPPRALARRYDESYSLRPNIDAYITNIEGFGHRLEPRIDLKSVDVDEKLTDAILMEQLYTPTESTEIGVTAKQLAAKKIEIKHAARIEKLRLQMFFENPTIGESFVQFRRRMRRDLEVTGNAYIEVVRNAQGVVSQLTLAPSVNMRLLRLGAAVRCDQKRRISPIAFTKVKLTRRFRRFIQTIDGTNRVVFFKEIGDPRTVSAKTGKTYATMAAFRKAEGKSARPATEMIHVKLDDPQSAYGSPRWQGGLMSVIGGRAAEEVNAAYFDEKTIPPGFLMVSGAPLKKGADKKIEQYLRDHIKGRRNFWSIVVIEAESKPVGPGQAPPRARLEWVPMTEQQQQDALFQNYDMRNGEKVGNMFRLPKILRGAMDDFNRSTAQEALRYAEQQVFEPERRAIDDVINDILFVHMDVKYWRFVSKSPLVRDPERLAEILDKDAVKDVMTSRETRKFIGDEILNIELEERDDEWMDVPIKVFEINAKAASGGAAPGAPGAEGGTKVAREPTSMLQTLAGMRDELQAAASNGAETEKRLAHMLGQMPQTVDVIAVPPDEFESLFGA